MGFFGRQKKQSVNGKGNLSMRTGPFDSAKLTPSERENNLLFSSEHSPSETFDLSECDMISIPQGVFSTCKNLRKKSLNLSNNRLCNLGEEDLDRLCGLCELNLENNNFKSLPKDLHKLVNLRILRLTNNPKLSNLKGVETLKKLEELHICETDISALDNCLTSLETLSIIEMGDKATLPIGDHEKTINLIMTAEQHPSELLDLADCGLWKPPKVEILHFTSLQLLDLSHNQLWKLPDEIGTLEKLEYLNISNNSKLETFPASFSNLTRLRFFDFTNTAIKTLPEFFDVSKFPELTDYRHDLDASGSSSASSPTSEIYKITDQGSDGVVDIFALQAEKEKKEFLAAVAYREAQEEEDQRAFNLQEETNTQDVARQLKYRELEMEREHQELNRLQDEEKEHKQLRDELIAAKEESDKLLSNLLDSDRLRKEQEDLIDFLRRHEAEEFEFFKISKKEQEDLDQEYICDAMKFLLQQEEDLSNLLVTVQREDSANQEVIKNFISDQNTNLLIPMEDVNAHMCLEEFENLQRIACQKLLERRDDELVRLRLNAEEIKRELQDLTHLEIKKQQVDKEQNKEWLEDRRLELSGLLGQFLKQETEREAMAMALLGKMQDQREQDQATFWLVQFQRLLQEKPLILRRMETELEAEVLEIIQRSNTTDSIECFATHRITWHQLRVMTDKDLERIGIYRLGDRKRLLDEVKKGATGILNKANAPGQKDIESNCDASTSAKDTTTAPKPNIPIINTSHTITTTDGEDNECCVCLDATRQLVFLPCGHVCTCKTCGEPLDLCPLCRADITQKINMFR